MASETTATQLPKATVELPRPSDASATTGAGRFAHDDLAMRDALGHDEILAPVADLITYVDGATPLSIGVFGPVGSGKSSAAARMVARARTRAASAALEQGSRHLPRFLSVTVNAPDITGDPTTAIAEALRSAMLSPGEGREAFPALAAEATREATDPHIAARDAADRLDLARKRLDGERRSMDELEARKARLVETILFEAAGTNIDFYARENRALIESRLRGFGFTGDPVANFKDLARQTAERRGPFAGIADFASATWAYRGQKKLVVWAAILVLLATGAVVAREHSEVWLDFLRGVSSPGGAVAEWMDARISWLDEIKRGLLALAAALLVFDAARALRFRAPINRGARLLAADVSTRRAQIEAAMAHQTRRVDSLSREVEALAEVVTEAERRVGKTVSMNIGESLAAPADANVARAISFLSHVSAATTRDDGGAPRRIVVVIDELDRVSPQRAVGIIESCHGLFARRGFVTILAADAARLATGWASPSEAAAQLDRMIDIPVRLPDADLRSRELSAFARGLLTDVFDRPSPSKGLSATDLDIPLRVVELALISELAPLAARTPRVAKRFVNIYRLARGRIDDAGTLALMLALDLGGSTQELAALGSAMDSGADDQPIVIDTKEYRLAAALAATTRSRGKPPTISEARAAWTIVRDYRMPL